MKIKTFHIHMLVLLLQANLFLEYDLSIISMLLYIGCIGAVILLSIKKVFMGVAHWWTYIYIICSFVITPLFKFIPSRFTFGSKYITDMSFDVMAQVSFGIVLCYYVALLLIGERDVRRSLPTDRSYFSVYFNLKIVFPIAFALTAFSHVVGIGQMGVETVKLPFHLAGIIQFSRTTVIPFLVLCTYAYQKTNGKKTTSTLVWMFLWTLLETFVRMSKGALLGAALPFFVYELLYDAKQWKSLIKRFAPIILTVLVLYPIIESFRHSDSLISAIDSADSEEVKGTYASPSTPNYIVKPFSRQFLTGFLFLADEGFVDSNNIFDFSKLPGIIASGSTPKYQTFVIDDYPIGVHHSSGTTPFIDSFLVGGYGLLFVSIFCVVFVAMLIDRQFRIKSNFVIITKLLLFFRACFDGPMFTYFMDPMSVRSLFFLILLCWYLLHKMKGINGRQICAATDTLKFK